MTTPKFRINMFEQFSAFYEHIWFAEFQFKQNHVSLYMFLLNQNNRSNWAPWFNLPLDLGQKGSCISSNKTYYKTLKELQEQDLIVYEKGANEWRAPRVQIKVLQRGKNTLLPTSLLPLKGESNYPSSGNLVTPQVVGDIDLKTEDLKIGGDQTSFLEDEKPKPKSIEDKTKPKPPKDLDEVLDYCYLTLKNYKFDAWGFYEWYESVHWYTNKSNPVRNWKNKLTTAINNNTKGLSDLRLSRTEQAQEYVYRVGELDKANVKLKGRANDLMKGLKNAIR